MRKTAPAKKPHAGLQAKFLAVYGEWLSISKACRAAGIGRSTHYDWLTDPDYAARFKEAHDTAVEAIKDEARRRAVEGTEKPVFYKGEVCGSIREYSDAIILALLKAHAPEFRDKQEVQHTGDVQFTLKMSRVLGTDADG